MEHVPNIETGTIRERIERLVAHVAEILVELDILALHSGPDRRSGPGPQGCVSFTTAIPAIAGGVLPSW